MCCDGCSFYCSVSGEQSGFLKPGRPLQLSAANNRIQQFVLMLQTGFCNHHWNKLFFFFLCLTPTLLYLLLCASAVWLNRDTSFGYSVGFCRCGIQQKSCVCLCARVCGAVITLVVRLRYNDLSPRVSQWQVLAFLYWVASNNKPASIHPSHLASALCLYRPT